jgi:hypothetical protein
MSGAGQYSSFGDVAIFDAYLLPRHIGRLRAVHAGGVQTAGNSCAVVDGAAAGI